ncbi:MAG UNVERIFIED_CONTAM: hypothetical protein LVR29_06005 [Microcystis novacekii LVE1205-3]
MLHPKDFVSGSDTLAVIDNDSVTLTLTILPLLKGVGESPKMAEKRLQPSPAMSSLQPP